MNEVDSLLRVPFNGLTLDEKLELKRLGPHQPADFELERQYKNHKRAFFSSWYNKYEWLTVSLGKKRLFCFYCLLFEDDTNTDKTWSSTGYDDLNHFYRSAKKHENSEVHLTCVIKFKTLGTKSIATHLDQSVTLSIRKHNEQVDKNRRILNRIIECIKFCGTHDLPLGGCDESGAPTSSNRGVFLDLLDLLASLDSQLEDHLCNASATKYTSNVIQNDILNCIYDVYREHILCELNDAEYVAIEADEATADSSCHSQFVVILRYCKDSLPVERVLKLIEVQDRSGLGLASVLMKEFDPLNIKKKLIAQAYDGTGVTTGASGGVQTLIQAEYPHAHYVQCYAYPLNFILKRVLEHITSIRLFFTNLGGFSSFFSVFQKRSDALKAVCSRSLPSPCQAQWNFQSRVIESVHNNRDSLFVCFENIIANPDGWDDNSIREACDLLRLLEDETFIYLLNFFHKIFGQVEILYNTFQACVTNGGDAVKCINDFIVSIQNTRDSLEEGPVASMNKKRRISMDSLVKANALEVCDVLMTHLASRFTEISFLTSFAALSPTNFVRFKTQFPDSLFEIIIQKYPFLCAEKLKSEWKVIYENESFSGHNCDSVTKLNRAIISTGLHTSFTETAKVLNIILTTPIASAEPERCFSTLKYVKNFLRNVNTMGQNQLDTLMILSIHKKEINTIVDFNARVIKRFAEMKTHRADFVYKY